MLRHVHSDDFISFMLVACTIYCIIVHTGKVESCVQIVETCAHWKISHGAENLVMQEISFEQVDIYRRSQWPRGLGHEVFSLAREFVSHSTHACLYAFTLCLCCPV
jgi:hypothetical protein